MEPAENRKFVYEFGRFSLDPNERVLLSDGRAIHLPAKEFETLLMLVENSGRALSKDEMMSRLWQDSFVVESNLAKLISNLRKILNTNGKQYIETRPKHGYRFLAGVRLVAKEPVAPIILERRTVKRVTFDVDDGPGAERLVLPPARRPFYRSWPALALVAVIGLGLLMWQYRDEFFTPDHPAIDPYAPIRLTDNPNDDTGPHWTRDGRIRFTRIFSDNHSEIWLMNADGTAQSAIPMPEGKRIFSWSPDEKKILFQKDGETAEFYIANADGSGEVLLPFRGGNWSPDSKMLVYHSWGNNSDIFVYSVEGGKTRNVTNSDAFDVDPSFSADGRQIAFSSGRDGNSEIYTMDLDGLNMRRLTFNPTRDSHPAFSPDGTQISFNSDRENENTDVFLMNADGSGSPIKLTNIDKSNETLGPGGWSLDGTRIAFFSDRNGKDDIYVMSAETVRPGLVHSNAERDIRGFTQSPDGKKIVYGEELPDKSGELKLLDLETRRTSHVAKTELPSSGPAWAPQGDWIVFHDRLEGNSEVCVIKPDGTGFTNLTNHPSQDVGPSWSPDGKRLAFVSYRGEVSSVPQLHSIDVDAKETRPITPRKGWESDPTWRPDGNLLVFVCDRQDSSGMMMDVCQIGVDGSDEKRLLARRDHDSQPAVSPDGNRIAFVARSDGNQEIYVMNSDGSGLVRVTRDPADDLEPEWTPDGQKLMFISNRGGRFAIYEIGFPF